MKSKTVKFPYVSLPPTILSLLTMLGGVGAFGLALLAGSSCAQSVPFADAKASFNDRLSATASATATDKSIRPFHINVPKAQLVDLRRRIAATQWPERETVSDETQGVQLATMQKLANYW